MKRVGLINEKSRPNSLKEESRSGGRPAILRL